MPTVNGIGEISASFGANQLPFALDMTDLSKAWYSVPQIELVFSEWHFTTSSTTLSFHLHWSQLPDAYSYLQQVAFSHDAGATWQFLSSANGTVQNVVLPPGPKSCITRAGYGGEQGPLFTYMEVSHPLSIRGNSPLNLIPEPIVADKIVMVTDSIGCAALCTNPNAGWVMLARDAHPNRAMVQVGGGGQSVIGFVLQGDVNQSAAIIAQCCNGSNSNTICFALGINDFGLIGVPGFWTDANDFGQGCATLCNAVHALVPTGIYKWISPILTATEPPVFTTYRAAINANKPAYETYIDGATQIVAVPLVDGEHPGDPGNVLYYNTAYPLIS
jgi:hypothetical protein